MLHALCPLPLPSPPTTRLSTKLPFTRETAYLTTGNSFVMRFLFCMLLLGAMSAGAQTGPKPFLIYYGWPSLINNSGGTVVTAASQFAQYRYVVLGNGLEDVTHGDHAKAAQIIQHPITGNVTFFGYIDLGVTTQNLTIADIQNRVQLWKAMGIDGIFLDDYGYDYGVSRQRQNDVVQYIHNQGLPVVANAWNADHAFGPFPDPTYNPAGISTVLNAGDFYLSESFAVSSWNYDPNWVNKAAWLEGYRNARHFKILATTTTDLANRSNFDQNRMNYAWFCAAVYGYEGFAWGEYSYSASGSNSTVAPFRPRPGSGFGTRYVDPPGQTGTRVFRNTDSGQLWVNTASNLYGFTGCGTCQTLSAGNWHAPATWSCGRVPLPCDDVIVSHAVTLSTADGQAKTLQLNSQLIYAAAFKIRVGIP